MTGFNVRIERDGVGKTLDVAELTDAELQEFFEGQPQNRLVRWSMRLAAWIRDNVEVEEA